MRRALLSVCLLLGCSKESPPASAGTVPTSSERARAVVDRIAAFPALRDRVGKTSTIARDASGFRRAASSSGERFAVASDHGFTVVAPTLANGAVHVAHADRPFVYVDVTSELSPVA